MSPAGEARAWIERLIRNAAECNAENEANPVGEEMCPPTHYSAIVRLKPLPDGRVSMYEPGVEVTPDRLQAFLDDHDRLFGEVEQLRRPLLVVQVDADLSEDDVARFRAKFAEAYAADPRPVWTVPTAASVRVVEWTLGDEDAPYDAGHVYAEADARALVADPDSTSVLWTREVTGWRKAEGCKRRVTAGR